MSQTTKVKIKKPYVDRSSRHYRFSSFAKSATSMRMEKIYLVASIFIAAGMAQMAVMRFTVFDLSSSVPVCAFMWMITALVCLLLMVYTELFQEFPINWTLSVVAVESMTLCVICYHWTSLTWFKAVGTLGFAIFINMIIYFYAAFMPFRFLPGYKVMVTSTVVFIIVYILMSIVVYAIRRKSFLAIVDLIAFIYVAILTLYGGTVIHDRQPKSIFTQEYILSGTIISIFFFMMVHLLLAVVDQCLDLMSEFNKKSNK